jgi:hypothetical protein
LFAVSLSAVCLFAVSRPARLRTAIIPGTTPRWAAEEIPNPVGGNKANSQTFRAFRENCCHGESSGIIGNDRESLGIIGSRIAQRRSRGRPRRREPIGRS